MDWQEKVTVFARENNVLRDPTTHILDLVSEVGEVVKAVLRATDYGLHAPEFGTGIQAEIGDSLYSLLVLASVCQVDADEALQQVLEEYQQRIEDHGNPGSE